MWWTLSQFATSTQLTRACLSFFKSFPLPNLAFLLLSGCYEMRWFTQANNVVIAGPKFSRNIAPVGLQLELTTRRIKRRRWWRMEQWQRTRDSCNNKRKKILKPLGQCFYGVCKRVHAALTSAAFLVTLQHSSHAAADWATPPAGTDLLTSTIVLSTPVWFWVIYQRDVIIFCLV